MSVKAGELGFYRMKQEIQIYPPEILALLSIDGFRDAVLKQAHEDSSSYIKAFYKVNDRYETYFGKPKYNAYETYVNCTTRFTRRRNRK